MAAWWQRAGLSIVLDPCKKESLEQFTGRMPILLRILANASRVGLNEGLQGTGFESEVVHGDEGEGEEQNMPPVLNSVRAICGRMMGLPELIKIVGAINKFATAKLEELNVAGDEEALRRYPPTPVLGTITMHY